VPLPVPDALLGAFVEDYRRLKLPALPAHGSLYVLTLPDGTIPPAFVRWAVLHADKENTAESYARDLKGLLEYHYEQDPQADWREIDSQTVSNYLNERRVAVASGTRARNVAGIRSFFEFAAGLGVVPPLAIPRSGHANFGKGSPISRAHWITRRAFDRWRDYGLQGWGSPSGESLALNERNVAAIELMLATGMRRAEAGSLLTVEIPSAPSHTRFAQGRVPGATSKGKPDVGRIFYLGETISGTLSAHISDAGERRTAIKIGRERGIYDWDPFARVMVSSANEGMILAKLELEEPGGRREWVKLDALTVDERMHVYRRTKDGLEPLWLWLGANGAPMSPAGWWHVLDAANRRLQTFERKHRNDPTFASIRLHPHMLRHTFVLHAYARNLVELLYRCDDVTAAARRDVARSDTIWKRLAPLLGHRSFETTKGTYGAPADSLDLDWYLDTVLIDPDAAPDLVEAIAQLDRRVLDVIE
jgi:integrase